MEIIQKYNWCEHIDPFKSKFFLEYYKHIVSTCAKLEGGDMLLVNVTLDPEASNKNQLMYQSDVPVITASDSDFDAPFPSRDVDGGDS